HSHTHPPPLRSLPTRRSSDLYSPAPALNPSHVPFTLTKITGLPTHPVPVSAKRTSTAVPALFSSPSPNVPFALTESRRLACRRQDRKSTRLNSSHVSISYAVF